jgi:LTXXQ motif family protein
MPSRKVLFIAAILAWSTTGVLAQTGTSPPAGTGTPAPATQGMPMGSMPGASGGMPMMGGQQMGGMPMMGMMQMMMGGMAAHVEGRIAFLKAELKITDLQQPLFNAVADAMRASAKDMAAMMPMMQSMMQPSGTLPEKLAGREKAMTAHLESLRKLKSAIDPLYAALSDEQKKT